MSGPDQSVRPDQEWMMKNKGSAEAVTQQIDEVRDRVADLLASDGGTRDGSRWPGRILWLGLGVGVGAAAAGGRLLKVLPAQLASRLEGLVGKVTSAASGLAEKAGALGSNTSERVEGITSSADETIDVTEQALEGVTEGEILG
jgi:hypothetical protein